MDIKLVRNFEEGQYSSVNEELLLQMIDGNRQLDRFTEKSILYLIRILMRDLRFCQKFQNST